MEKQRLMNVYVNNLTMMESVNRIHDMIREKQTSYVVEVNVDVDVDVSNSLRRPLLILRCIEI